MPVLVRARGGRVHRGGTAALGLDHPTEPSPTFPRVVNLCETRAATAQIASVLCFRDGSGCCVEPAAAGDA
jgi:hypothetical protein